MEITRRQFTLFRTRHNIRKISEAQASVSHESCLILIAGNVSHKTCKSIETKQIIYFV